MSRNDDAAYLLHAGHVIKSGAVCGVEVEVVGFAVAKLVLGGHGKPGRQLPHVLKVGWHTLQGLGGSVWAEGRRNTPLTLSLQQDVYCWCLLLL